jgi:hypothetical protein
MTILSSLNAPVMYLICGSIVLFVAVVCVVFMVRAWRQGLALGMDKLVLKNIITSSVSFSVLPSIGILLGVIALSGALGIPWPWLRLSVIGALHYEMQVAAAAAEQVGMGSLTAGNMTAQGFATIALLMSVCIMWGMVLSVFFNKKYSSKVAKAASGGGFGDKAMDAMFVGLVSCYIGSYIGDWISGGGDWLSLFVAVMSGACMALFMHLGKKYKLAWLENFSLAGSMFFGMAMAVIVRLVV